MAIKPLGGRVLVKLLKKEEVTKSGIVLPDTADKEKKSEAEVIALGPGKLLENGERASFEVAVGQTRTTARQNQSRNQTGSCLF